MGISGWILIIFKELFGFYVVKSGFYVAIFSAFELKHKTISRIKALLYKWLPT